MVTDKIESWHRDGLRICHRKDGEVDSQEQGMRSELIFTALTRESNRYMLVRLAAKATRILHWPNTRIQDTMNDALKRLAHCGPTADPETQQS
jgi:hypothetical protein